MALSNPSDGSIATISRDDDEILIRRQRITHRWTERELIDQQNQGQQVMH